MANTYKIFLATFVAVLIAIIIAFVSFIYGLTLNVSGIFRYLLGYFSTLALRQWLWGFLSLGFSVPGLLAKVSAWNRFARMDSTDEVRMSFFAAFLGPFTYLFLHPYFAVLISPLNVAAQFVWFFSIPYVWCFSVVVFYSQLSRWCRRQRTILFALSQQPGNFDESMRICWRAVTRPIRFMLDPFAWWFSWVSWPYKRFFMAWVMLTLAHIDYMLFMAVVIGVFVALRRRYVKLVKDSEGKLEARTTNGAADWLSLLSYGIRAGGLIAGLASFGASYIPGREINAPIADLLRLIADVLRINPAPEAPAGAHPGLGLADNDDELGWIESLIAVRDRVYAVIYKYRKQFTWFLIAVIFGVLLFIVVYLPEKLMEWFGVDITFLHRKPRHVAAHKKDEPDVKVVLHPLEATKSESVPVPVVVEQPEPFIGPMPNPNPPPVLVLPTEPVDKSSALCAEPEPKLEGVFKAVDTACETDKSIRDQLRSMQEIVLVLQNQIFSLRNTSAAGTCAVMDAAFESSDEEDASDMESGKGKRGGNRGKNKKNKTLSAGFGKAAKKRKWTFYDTTISDIVDAIVDQANADGTTVRQFRPTAKEALPDGIYRWRQFDPKDRTKVYERVIEVDSSYDKTSNYHHDEDYDDDGYRIKGGRYQHDSDDEDDFDAYVDTRRKGRDGPIEGKKKKKKPQRVTFEAPKQTVPPTPANPQQIEDAQKLARVLEESKGLAPHTIAVKVDGTLESLTPFATRWDVNHVKHCIGEAVHQGAQGLVERVGWVLVAWNGVWINRHVLAESTHLRFGATNGAPGKMWPLKDIKISHELPKFNTDIVILRRMDGFPTALPKRKFLAPEKGMKVKMVNLEVDSEGQVKTAEEDGSHGKQCRVTLSTKDGDCGSPYVDVNGSIVGIHFKAGSGQDNLGIPVSDALLQLDPKN